jgi:putative oxidoreductase
MLTRLRTVRDQLQTAGWAALPLRLLVGAGFIAHGLAKLGRGPEHFTGILAALGLPAPGFLAWATILVELAGGALVLMGVAITLAAVPMAVVLVVAIVTVHLPNGFSSIKLQSVDRAGAHFGQPGYETDLLYLACLATLIVIGPGRLSLASLARRGAARSTRSILR